MDMLQFEVTNRITKERLILSDRQIDKGGYDLRVWDIVPRSDIPKCPYMVLQVIAKQDDGKLALTYFPVFQPSDLFGVRISTGGNFYTEASLTPEQKFWLDSKLESHRWGLVLH